MGSYVDLPSIRMWFDERPGDANRPPAVLLHGGMCTADTWAMQLDAVAADGRRVLLPEQRGHGHTADPGEISYSLMAADTVAFLEAVAGTPADLVGWSDGGNVAIHVALARPDLVCKLVLIGSNFHHEGTLPAFLEGAAGESADDPLRGLYDAASPDGPDHWPVVKAKLLEMWRTSPTLAAADLAGIDRPALVLVGDDDAVALAHTVALYESLPQGQLAVVPGTSHLVPLERPDLVNQLVVDFLDDGTVRSLLPMRRAAADA